MIDVALLTLIQAQESPCAPYLEMLKGLADKAHEQPVAHALEDGSSVLTLTAIVDGNTYSLLLTRPDGSTCFVGTGRDWQAVTPPAAGDPA